ncbi:HD domain-containing phosphohydrolase [Burkholderia ubonensis]|uniref:HD domain-containing phosphohydrolase n=1 Tax=Burkholderia ubonensis TaxID=101571 RepID=UPI001E478B7E|nr:HD domain-containing phosphohydrolase [Burkholderia ubonensis]
MLLGVGTLASASNYIATRLSLQTAAADLSRRISHETVEGMQTLLSPTETVVRIVSHSLLVNAKTPQERLEFIPMLRDALETSPALHALYIGYANGDFFVIQRFISDAERRSLGAPPAASYVVQSIGNDQQGPHGFNLFLDSGLAPLSKVDAPDYARSLRIKTRPWFIEALSAGRLIRTDPYLFYLGQGVGATFAMPTADRRAVVGADLRLETLGQLLAEKKTSDSMIIGLLDAHGHVLASGDNRDTVHGALGSGGKVLLSLASGSDNRALAYLARQAMSLGKANSLREQARVDGRQWYMSIDRVAQDGGKPLFLVLAVPVDELLNDAEQHALVTAAWTVLLIVLSIPLAWLVARVISRPLHALAVQANAIRRFDFSETTIARSRVREVNALAYTMSGMRTAIRRFLDITRALTSEPAIDRVLPMLVRETMDAAASDAGALYLVKGESLEPAYAWARPADEMTAQLSAIPLATAPTFVRQALREGVAATGNATGGESAAPALSALVSRGGAHAAAVPLVARDGELIGVTLLFRETPLQASQLAFVSALAGLSANVLEMRGLTQAQRDLFDAFIQLIAGAIDAKNPHTGGHCERVPAIVELLARAACDAREGPFAPFSMTDAQWEALHVAAWLHDCGKITTPEYVIDKATKLETLHDRIHEVRTRFEVLKRDAEIRSLRAQLAGEDARTADARCAAEWRELDEEFALVAECNRGAENMDDAKIRRLEQVAQRTWLRTLDDRIGISYEELARKQRVAATPLPAVEPLLADKPEHRIARGECDAMPEDNPWGFKLDVPELLYHRGELYNLSVARGTLSKEERYKIEEHIVQTQMMLSRLPFPKHLREVPEIAGSHHEAMDGTGYPRRLKRDEMSVPARMMAIADVFEALTAKDRPYKQGKKLSESIRIMASMKARNRIDPDLFDLFLRSGAFRRYAERFMAAEQIDDVDVSQYLVGAETAETQ